MGTAGTKPHLIFLCADQMRLDLLDAYGDRQTPTPKLDILAQRSAIFERHYTNCPLCVPAKSTMMTGLPPHRHGAIVNGWLPGEKQFGCVRAGTPLLPRLLADSGYRAVMAGVQHLRTEEPIERALRGVEFIGPGGPAEHHKDLVDRGLMLGDLASLRNPVIEHDAGRKVVTTATSARTATFPLREDLFYDCVIAERVATLLDGHDPAKPLALFVNFWLPHPPFWAPRTYTEMFDPEAVKLPNTVGRWLVGQPVLQLANVCGQLGAHVTAEQWQKTWAVYMGMTALLDKCVGRVLAHADYSGLFDGAVVVFTSDHGEMLGCHGLLGKMCLYEESVRVPLLVKMPGQGVSRRVTELSDHTDLAATVAAVCGLGAIKGSPGRSLASLAQGVRSAEPRRHVFAAYDGNAGRGFPHRMVRSQTHKFIHNLRDRAELYDLIEDPHETRNLVGREEDEAAERELRAVLRRWMIERGEEAEAERV